jgi:hypothetical protein
MSTLTDSIMIHVPKSLVDQMPSLSDDLVERMHELLERNTEGDITLPERAQLETLVQMAQFSQIFTMALQATPT